MRLIPDGVCRLDARRLEVTFPEPVVHFEKPGQDTDTRSTAVRDDWLGVTAEDLAAPLGWPHAQSPPEPSRAIPPIKA